jgi:hypothetical protein
MFRRRSTLATFQTVSEKFTLYDRKITLKVNNPWYSYLWLLKEWYKGV